MEKKLTREEYINKHELHKIEVYKEIELTCLLDYSKGCTFDDLINALIQAKKDYGDKKDVEIEECEYDEKYNTYLAITYHDLEDDKEYNKRIDYEYDGYLCCYEEEMKEKKENNYQKELKALNKKYHK